MTVVLAMVLGLTSATMFANSDIRVVVDGVEVNFVDQGPIMEDSRILAPVRGVFTHMGFVPSWNNDTRVATLTGDGVTVVIPVGNTHFYVNGERVNTDIASRILNDRVMLPLGAIATAVGATAAWDAATSTATVTTAAYEPTPEPVDEDEDYDVEDEDYDAEDEDYDVEDEDYDEEDEDYDVEDEDYDEEDEDADEEDEDADDDNVADYAFLGTWFTADERRWMFNADRTGFDSWDAFTWVMVDGEYLILTCPITDYYAVVNFEGGDGNVFTLRLVESAEDFMSDLFTGDYIMLLREFAS